MQFTVQSIMQLVGETLRQPHSVAARLKPEFVPRNVLWLIIIVLSVLSAILATLGGTVSAGALMAKPFGMAIMTFGLLILTIFGSQLVCRFFGGTGTLNQAMLLLSWQHFVVLCLQVVGFLASIILAPLSGLITLGIGVIAFWQMAVFIKVLHDFKSLGNVIGGILALYFGVAFFAFLILAPQLGGAM